MESQLQELIGLQREQNELLKKHLWRLKYSLLTQYTSFVAVREKVVNNTGSAENVEQPLPLPVGVSDMAVGSEPELIWLASFGLLVALFMVVRTYRNRRRTVSN